MSKNLNITMLFDFYGNFLTDKQREVIEMYYNDDLSLAEIAQHTNISRQGVRDSIKRGEQTLFEAEEKLQLVKRFNETQKVKASVVKCAEDIVSLCSEENVNCNEILKNAQKILNKISKFDE
jgi:predicted DNA-binding protein YlxM (UPF0122 family)